MSDGDRQVVPLDPTAAAYDAGYTLGRLFEAMFQTEDRQRVEVAERTTHHYPNGETVVVEKQVVIEETRTRRR